MASRVKEQDATERMLEEGVGLIYTAFFRMRNNKEYQREYNSMGSILSMIHQDRAHMRKTYDIKI